VTDVAGRGHRVRANLRPAAEAGREHTEGAHRDHAAPRHLPLHEVADVGVVTGIAT
jgi:hypothetical protein